jgi:hypothetical protein
METIYEDFILDRLATECPRRLKKISQFSAFVNAMTEN